MKPYKIKSILNVTVWLTLGLTNLSPSIASEQIVSAETKSATIEFDGETHSYYFQAVAGQGVVIEMSRISGGIDPRVQLYDANGIQIAISEVMENNTPRAIIEDHQLNMSGIYTIVASDGSWNVDTGEYGLSLVLIPGATKSPQDPNGGCIASGETKTGNIYPAGDTDAYCFYGQTGQGVVIEISRISGALEPRVQLYDPNGIRVAISEVMENNTPRAVIEDYQLNMSGIYTIVVSDGSWNVDTGEYGLSFAVIPPIDPHGLYPYGPQPADGQIIDYCDPNYQFADIVVENMILPDGNIVTRRSGAYLLSWFSVIGATGYDVYFSESPCMPLEMVAENIIDSWLPMPIVEGGQVYFWRVVAHTPNGDVQGPTWWFVTELLVSCALNISVTGQGLIVEPNEGYHGYSCGEVVSVTAMADINYEFVGWEGTAVDADKIVVKYQDYMGSTVQVTVDGAYTLKAVFEEVIYDFPLDSDPGWIMEGQWEYGIPSGQGGREHGNPDPISGYTGQHVIGVNLNGDYDVEIGGPYSVVAGPFDLRGYRSVHLRFWSWLNTDWADYVKNSLEMSLDGKTWLLVLHNPEQEDVISDTWSRWECGIGSWADGQPEVYLRWSYEVLTERAYPYSGWNLDDIQLIGRR
jgi:hypothetical protein